MSDNDHAPPSGTVTADDVAALAGVSRWTVTRAFKPDASVSERTRKKVMEAAERLGYAPDLLAASLASDRSNLVSLLIDDFSNPHKLVMMERLTRILRRHGWGTLLVNTLDEADAGAALQTASQRRVDAAVLIGSSFDDQALSSARWAQKVRKLIVFARLSGNPNTISICCDDRAAMAEMTAHVLARGYQRPAFLAGPQTPSAHVLRKETFMTTWQARTGHMPDLAVIGSYDPQQAYQRTAAILSGCDPDSRPDILVCENDAIAMGASDAVRFELGLRIPEDIAITGFDDTPQAANPNYRLTTYHQPISEMAEALARILKGEGEADAMQSFVGKLVVRASA